MNQTPHCCGSWKAPAGSEMWSWEESRAIRAIARPANHGANYGLDPTMEIEAAGSEAPPSLAQIQVMARSAPEPGGFNHQS
jgi:hypothetical protein